MSPLNVFNKEAFELNLSKLCNPGENRTNEEDLMQDKIQ